MPRSASFGQSCALGSSTFATDSKCVSSSGIIWKSICQVSRFFQSGCRFSPGLVLRGKYRISRRSQSAGVYSDRRIEKKGKGCQFRTLGFHSLRHTFVSELGHADVPAHAASALRPGAYYRSWIFSSLWPLICRRTSAGTSSAARLGAPCDCPGVGGW